MVASEGPINRLFPIAPFSRISGGFGVISITKSPKSAMIKSNEQKRRYKDVKATRASMSKSCSWHCLASGSDTVDLAVLLAAGCHDRLVSGGDAVDLAVPQIRGSRVVLLTEITGDGRPVG